MIVSKSFKHLVDRAVKKGVPLPESGLNAHKDFDPFIEELARNSKEWGQRPQHGFTLHEIDFGGGHVHVFFKEAGQGNVIGVSLKEEDVMEGLKNAQTED